MKFLIPAFLLAFMDILSAQQPDQTQEITVPVQSAIIYLYGAELTQSKLVTLNPGRNRILFKGLSPKLNSKSVQVSTGAKVSILAISDQINYLSENKGSIRIEQLRDSVTLLEEAIAITWAGKDAYQNEKNMLLQNQKIGGNEKGVPVAELKLAADLFRNRMKEINLEIYRLDKKTATLNETLNKLNQQLAELSAKGNRSTAEISVLIHSDIKQTVNLELKYIVADAGWAPSYDLHAEDVNQPIELKYRGKVFNNTGIDWNDIKIMLSTADPTQSAAKPVLNQWNLDYQVVSIYKKQKIVSNYNEQPTPSAYQMDENAKDYYVEGQQVQKIQKIEFEEIQVAELSAEFDIKNKYSVPSDSKPYIVDITEYKLPASYKHYCVPKVDHDAFLLARITGWESLDLVEGPANIYYAGTYVGQSYIQTRSVDDTLDLSLGRDNKVLVTRTKIKDFSSKKLIGNISKETFGYEIVVKNNRKTTVQIEIEDQIPVSMQSEIIVEALETSKGEMDTKTGKLTWNYNLQPGEMKKITLSFSVKYPKNSPINLQQTKTKMRAKF